MATNVELQLISQVKEPSSDATLESAKATKGVKFLSSRRSRIFEGVICGDGKR